MKQGGRECSLRSKKWDKISTAWIFREKWTKNMREILPL
jgi:hypothetical protein